MSSIVDVWGTPFPKTYHTMASKYGNKQETRDPEKEGRIHPTPEKRHMAAVLKHRKVIDNLSSALPIAESDEEMDSNYMPVKVMMNGQEHMTPKYTSPYLPIHELPSAQPTQYYQPQVVIPRTNAKPNLRSRAVTRDMILYIFTGVFFLFTLDTFVTLGRSMH